ncbi:MAG: serine protease [Bacteroidales bacterium]|nr:serine protease [Bacteroidales bacterium]MBN2698332.1 serine protease [Bacteroidales bacterium]
MAGIIILIVLGILLFVIEFLLVPGITIAGIGGLVLTVLAIFKAFNDFGTTTGIWVTIGTVVLSIFVIAMSLRARTWSRLMLRTNIDGTVDTSITEEEIKRGDTGIAITRLAPMGKVKVNNIVREAKSTEGYVNVNTEIVVVSVEGTRLIVKPLNK